MRRTGPSALALPVTAFVASLWLAVACGIQGSATAPVPAPATASASAGPTALAPATPLPTAAQMTTPTGASLDPNVPPTGWLSTGGDPVGGLLGAYCWHANGVGTCVDSVAFTDREPDLPVLALAVAGTQLHFSLADAYPFATWSASYVDDNGKVVPLGGSDASFDPDAAHPSITTVTAADFPASPAGDQSIVQLFIRFADGGDASYGWNVTVP